jgi:hypothetical protein
MLTDLPSVIDTGQLKFDRGITEGLLKREET